MTEHIADLIRSAPLWALFAAVVVIAVAAGFALLALTAGTRYDDVPPAEPVDELDEKAETWGPPTPADHINRRLCKANDIAAQYHDRWLDQQNGRTP